jgi:hypothetical protein
VFLHWIAFLNQRRPPPPLPPPPPRAPAEPRDELPRELAARSMLGEREPLLVPLPRPVVDGRDPPAPELAPVDGRAPAPAPPRFAAPPAPTAPVPADGRSPDLPSAWSRETRD